VQCIIYEDARADRPTVCIERTERACVPCVSSIACVCVCAARARARACVYRVCVSVRAVLPWCRVRACCPCPSRTSRKLFA